MWWALTMTRFSNIHSLRRGMFQLPHILPCLLLSHQKTRLLKASLFHPTAQRCMWWGPLVTRSISTLLPRLLLPHPPSMTSPSTGQTLLTPQVPRPLPQVPLTPTPRVLQALGPLFLVPQTALTTTLLLWARRP